MRDFYSFMKKLTRHFYARDTITVAKELLGKYLVHIQNDITQIAKIVEVEAYLGGHDLASHSSKGITNRTRIMFGPAGYAYIYLIYGMYYCLNVVTGQEGEGCAVLIRAVEPIQNIPERTQGPGLLCKAFGINKNLNGHDLLSANFYIAEPEQTENFHTIKKSRIGVAYAKQWARRLLRFYIKGNPFVSRY